jgi:hypothetical protein
VPVYITNIRTRQANNPLTRLPGPTTVALSPFATDPRSVVRQFCVRVTRPEAVRLVLEYDLRADPAAVRLEDPAGVAGGAGPTDGLWRHTCMELFASHKPPGAYVEFNLAPDGRWAAYRFSGYRAGMAPLTGIRPPRIELQIQSDALLLRADIALPAELAAAQLQLGIAAVVENRHGQLSYWALRHSRDRPDFHHPDGFAFEI